MPSGDSRAPVARFALAPMSTDLRILTWIILVIPLALYLGAL